MTLVTSLRVFFLALGRNKIVFQELSSKDVSYLCKELHMLNSNWEVTGLQNWTKWRPMEHSIVLVHFILKAAKTNKKKEIINSIHYPTSRFIVSMMAD